VPQRIVAVPGHQSEGTLAVSSGVLELLDPVFVDRMYNIEIRHPMLFCAPILDEQIAATETRMPAQVMAAHELLNIGCLHYRQQHVHLKSPH